MTALMRMNRGLIRNDGVEELQGRYISEGREGMLHEPATHTVCTAALWQALTATNGVQLLHGWHRSDWTHIESRVGCPCYFLLQRIRLNRLGMESVNPLFDNTNILNRATAIIQAVKDKSATTYNHWSPIKA